MSDLERLRAAAFTAAWKAKPNYLTIADSDAPHPTRRAVTSDDIRPMVDAVLEAAGVEVLMRLADNGIAATTRAAHAEARVKEFEAFVASARRDIAELQSRFDRMKDITEELRAALERKAPTQ